MSLVTSVKIENFKNIKLAEFKTGKFNQITGKNSQGKTSVSQAIEFAHRGSMDTGLIKLGEEKASVEIHFEDGAVLSRWLKKREGAKPTTAVKYERDGMTPNKIQAHLNGMIGVGTFNPREILNPKTRDQFIMEMIDLKLTKKDLSKSLKGLSLTIPELDYSQNALTVLDKAEAHFFSIRTERNRETKSAKQRHSDAKVAVPEKPELTMPYPLDEIKLSKDALADELLDLKQNVKDWEADESSILDAQEKHANIVRAHDDLQKERDELTRRIIQLDDDLGNREAEINKSMKELGEKPDIIAETERIINEGTALAEEIQRHKDIESVDNQEAAVKFLDEAYLAAAAISNNLDQAIDRLRGSFKSDILASADLPIKGLQFQDGKFNLAGRSLDLLSGSEALIIGLQLTRKKNPHTSIISIDGGECLDNDTYQNLQKAVADDGFNYFLTKVGEPFQSETDTVIDMNKGEPSAVDNRSDVSKLMDGAVQ